MDTQTIEPEANATEYAAEELKQEWSPFSERPWPHFPDKSVISRYDAEFICRASCGIYGIAKILQRNQTFTNEVTDFEDAENFPLHPADAFHLWCGLIAISEKLCEHIEEWSPEPIEEAPVDD